MEKSPRASLIAPNLSLIKPSSLIQINSQKKALDQAQIKIEIAQEKLLRHKISGPSQWVLNKRLIEPGSWLNPGDAICELVDLRQLSIYFRLGQNEIHHLQKTKLQLWSLSQEKYIEASIHHIDLNFDQNSRKQLLEIRITNNPTHPIISGQEFELQLKVDYPNPTVLIPAKFVFKKLARHYVKLENGTDIAINPLRKISGQYVVDGKHFNSSSTLMVID
jgi:membrane fusion protein, multidrug efflux system